jgi:hypothetical protein
MKSNPSKKSQHSSASKNLKPKLLHSRSGFGLLDQGGLSNEELRQLEKENEKDIKKMSNLEK